MHIKKFPIGLCKFLNRLINNYVKYFNFGSNVPKLVMVNQKQNTIALILIFFLFFDRFLFSEQEYIYIYIFWTFSFDQLPFYPFYHPYNFPEIRIKILKKCPKIRHFLYKKKNTQILSNIFQLNPKPHQGYYNNI